MRTPRLAIALSLTLAGTLVACGSSGGASTAEDAVSTSTVDPGNAGGNKFVTVMDRNVYIGGAVEPFFDPSVTATMIPALAAHLWATVQLTDFFERAEAIADEIEQTGAALIGLQEAALWRTQFPGDSYLPGGGVPATDVAYDFIDILLDALQARGLTYRAVVVQENIDVEAITSLGLDVRLTDRDAILARADVKVLDTDSGNYAAAIPVPLGGPGGPTVDVIRGWTAALVKIQGVEFVFANTHLEPFSPIIQSLQAAELYGVLSAYSVPVVLVGDLNSEPGEPTYALFTTGGYVDAFAAVHPGADGFTCCQAEDLLNPTSLLDERVDYVLLNGALTPMTAVVVGDEPADRTASGLWPADHAGVAVRFRLEDPKFFALH